MREKTATIDDHCSLDVYKSNLDTFLSSITRVTVHKMIRDPLIAAQDKQYRNASFDSFIQNDNNYHCYSNNNSNDYS